MDVNGLLWQRYRVGVGLSAKYAIFRRIHVSPVHGIQSRRTGHHENVASAFSEKVLYPIRNIKNVVAITTLQNVYSTIAIQNVGIRIANQHIVDA